MKLFKTRTILFPVALTVGAGAAAVLKPWWDRVREQSAQQRIPAPIATAGTPPLPPASADTTETQAVSYQYAVNGNSTGNTTQPALATSKPPAALGYTRTRRITAPATATSTGPANSLIVSRLPAQ
jgi:hypothetical protein